MLSRVVLGGNLLWRAHRRPALSSRLWQAPRPKHEARPYSMAAVLDSCFTVTHEAMATLHATTGLPWVWTLPLAAVCIRTAFVLPLEVWARQHRHKAAEVRPLLAARAPIIQAMIVRENPTRTVAQQRELFQVQLRQDRKQMWRKFGIKRYPAFAPFLQLPLWLVVLETVRKMCGTSKGILGLVGAASNPTEDGSEVVPTVHSVLVEPAFATEGALWFPNLLVPDPQLLLPFMLSALLFTNVTRGLAQQRAEGFRQTKGVSRFTRLLQAFSLAIGPLTLAMPAAMHVYWISSASCAMVHSWILGYVLPPPPTAQPCKLPGQNVSAS